MGRGINENRTACLRKSCVGEIAMSDQHNRGYEQRLALVVSTTALTLVARSRVHNSLVDLPLRASLVTGFGL